MQAMKKDNKLFFATIMLLSFMLALAGCGSPSEGTQAPIVSGKTPAATKTPAPTATPALGQSKPCSGGLWGHPIGDITSVIPLPPDTTGGIRETFPSDGTWVGQITRLCTSGTIDEVNQWEQDHMSSANWTLGPAPSSCVSCANQPVWTHAGDSRLVQFEQNPTQVHTNVQWSVIFFTRG